jgi:RsiW-degrading membrane proteinase PrsW (M82 family)
MLTTILAIMVATIIPVAFLYGFYVMDRYRIGEYRIVIYSFLWGTLAYLMAVQINNALIHSEILTRNQLLRFGAPVVEEILKGSFLLYLVRRPKFTYFVDGAIYGFAAGIGFAVLENFEYIFGHPDVALSLAISRVLSTNLIHGAACSLLGISFGLSRVERSRLRRWLIPLAGLLLAMSLHSGFNNMVNDGFALVFAFVAGLGAAGLIYAAMRRGLQEEKRWIEQSLGMTDSVTSNEAAIVNRIESMEKILAPVATRFGSQTASRAEEFLLIQARLGIKRKTLGLIQDPKMLAAIEADMAEMRAKMDATRRAVGAYAMLYLRNIYPPDASPILALLDQRLAGTDKSLAATGLWKTLGSRMNQTDSE